MWCPPGRSHPGCLLWARQWLAVGAVVARTLFCPPTQVVRNPLPRHLISSRGLSRPSTSHASHRRAHLRLRPPAGTRCAARPVLRPRNQRRGSRCHQSSRNRPSGQAGAAESVLTSASGAPKIRSSGMPDICKGHKEPISELGWLIRIRCGRCGFPRLGG